MRRGASEVAVMRGWTDWPGEGEMEGFLECWRGGPWKRTERAAPFVQTSSVENGAIAQISSLFSTSCVCDVEPICLPGRRSKDPYLLLSSAAPRLPPLPLFVCESEAPPTKSTCKTPSSSALFARPSAMLGRSAEMFPLFCVYGILVIANLFCLLHHFDPLTTSRSERERTLIWTDDVAPPQKTQTLC